MGITCEIPGIEARLVVGVHGATRDRAQVQCRAAGSADVADLGQDGGKHLPLAGSRRGQVSEAGGHQ